MDICYSRFMETTLLVRLAKGPISFKGLTAVEMNLLCRLTKRGRALFVNGAYVWAGMS